MNKKCIYWLSLARNACTAQAITRRWTFYFTKTDIEIQNAFRPF